MTRESAESLSLDKTPRRIEGMFDAIAGRYDLLNRLLSVGLDQSWRARAVESLRLTGRESVLDLCTGTADLALALTASHAARRVVGVDFAAEMLRYGRQKVVGAPHGGQIELLRGDAMRVPLGDSCVDAATIAFGIRNVSDPVQTLREVRRVLRPGRRLAILEFGYPRMAALKLLYLWYFRTVLPMVGHLVSRHRSAYRYLPESVGAFYEPAIFCQVLRDVGFLDVRSVPLTFGIVYLYEATTPA